MPWRRVFDLGGFDAASIDVLAQAIDEAATEVTRSPEFHVEDEEACRFALARRHVVEAAQGGERNVQQLVRDALFKFRL